MKKKKDINPQFQKLGQMLGLSDHAVLKAKRTMKNVIAMALLAGLFMMLGRLLMPGGPVGLYYSGGSIKDFQILFGWFL